MDGSGEPNIVAQELSLESVSAGDEQGPGMAGEGEEAATNLVVIQVTPEQESAMEAFFQINSWQLIKESQGDSQGVNDGSTARSLCISVTQEQEAAMEAFFQINNWALIKEVPGEIEGSSEEVNTVQIDNLGNIIKGGDSTQAHTSLQTLVEEVQGLQEVQVTATGMNGQPQIITVYTESGAAGIPQSLLTDGGGGGADGGMAMGTGMGGAEGRDLPQVIIQEITLPEGMSLDQGLIIANPNPTVRRVVPRGTVKPGDKIHKCHVCGKTFKQAQSFNGHYQSHFGAKPYQCEICQTGFTLKAALVAHNTIHTGAKPYSCSLCQKSFRRKDDMISHLRTHTGEKPYACDICGKKFKYRNQIPKHRRGHTGERPYPCKMCDKAFTSNIHLRRHERTHTGERPYKCLVCPKAFTQYGHLQAHTRIHTDERPFPCSICGRGFREKKVMKKHEALHTSERPYKCETCGKGFLRQSNLELHAVMHQKPLENGHRVRPRPKKKKQPDAEMREFVANVLSNVKKVDSGMQTENYIHGVPSVEETVASDNLSALVNLAVEQGQSSVIKTEQIAGLPAVGNEEQYTLVMQDDGSEGYLISNYEGEAVTEEVVTDPSDQVGISSELTQSQANDAAESTASLDYTGDLVVKTLQKIVQAEHASESSPAAVTSKPVSATASFPQPQQITIVNPVPGKNQVQKNIVPTILPRKIAAKPAPSHLNVVQKGQGITGKLPQINVIQGGQTVASIPVSAGKVQIPAGSSVGTIQLPSSTITSIPVDTGPVTTMSLDVGSAATETVSQAPDEENMDIIMVL